jgi:hypothetical protein
MPRRGVEGSFCQKTEAKLPASGIRSNGPIRPCPRQINLARIGFKRLTTPRGLSKYAEVGQDI